MNKKYLYQVMIFILYFICFYQIGNSTYENTSLYILQNKLSCDNIKIILDNNISLSCGNQFNYSIGYDELKNYNIDVKESINFINSSNINFSNYNFNEINETINKENETKVIFTEFQDITAIETFALNLSISYQNIFITMEWDRYLADNNTYCQWDYVTNSSTFDKIQNHFDTISDNSRWKKLCMNNQAYLHYVEEPQGEIIMIPKTTLVLLIVFIVFLIIAILISLYLIALCRYYHTKAAVGNENSEASLSSQDQNENQNQNNEIENDDKNENNSDCESQYNINNEDKDDNDNENQNIGNDCCCCDDSGKCKDLMISCANSEKMLVFVQFFKQLLGIGNSAGSLVSEAIHLLRIFQRLSATRTFSVHFSSDCLKMFSWATNIIDIIFANFYLRAFFDIELFYIINYVFPLLMITFLVLLFLNYKFYLLLFISACFAALGFGFGYIQFNVKVSIAVLIPFLFVDSFIVFIIVFLFHKYGFDLYNFIENDQYTVISSVGEFYLPFSFTVFNTLIITTVILIPFFLNDTYFLGTYIFVFFILIIISFVIDLIIGSLQDFVSISVILVNNLPLLFTNILTLLFVPSTDLFTELMIGEYNNNWNCIIGFIVFALALPALITLLLIFFDNPDLFDKYREYYFVYYEFIDMARQIAYAFVSAYDLPWACIIIEICWILAFSIPKIYTSYSEYVLQGGSSLIIITGNTIALVCKYTNTEYISFKWFLFLVCAAFFLAIIAFYVYFGTEFEIIEEDPHIKEDKVKISIYMTIFFVAITPITWFFFGLFIPIIMNHFNNFNSTYHEL